jgi:RNA polymerase sigma-70 factor, ECF subfamily
MAGERSRSRRMGGALRYAPRVDPGGEAVIASTSRGATTELVDAARAGDRAALERLLREQRTTVVRYAVRLCVSPQDAEDATQEALLALSRYVGALREAAALSRWLFTAVRTHCVRLARRSLRLRLAGDDVDLEDLAPSAEDVLVDEQLRRRLARVIGELDPAQREVLVERDILGTSAAETAAKLGTSVDAVKSRLHRARTSAKEALLRDIERPPRR